MKKPIPCLCGDVYAEVFEPYIIMDSIVIPSLMILRCPKCKDELLPPESQKKIDEVVDRWTKQAKV